MDLKPIRKRSLRPERVPSFLWQVGVVAVFYALGIYGTRLADHGVSYPAARAFGPPFCLAVSGALIVGAVLVKRWQRKPPTRTTAKVEEADAQQSAWAESVLSKRRGTSAPT